MGLADQGLVAIRTCGEPPAGWDELLGADPGADFFHSPAWSAAACANYPDLEPIWLVAESGGRMVGGLPAVRRTRRSVLPLSVDHLESSLEGTSGGPVVRDDLPLEIQESVFQGLVQNFLDLRKGLSGQLFHLTQHQPRKAVRSPAAGCFRLETSGCTRGCHRPGGRPGKSGDDQAEREQAERAEPRPAPGGRGLHHQREQMDRRLLPHVRVGQQDLGDCPGPQEVSAGPAGGGPGPCLFCLCEAGRQSHRRTPLPGFG